MRIKTKKKYWYKIYVYVCQVCGPSKSSYRERVYSKKPKLKKNRYVFLTDYDGCVG